MWHKNKSEAGLKPHSDAGGALKISKNGMIVLTWFPNDQLSACTKCGVV